ncbi:MAG: hypothetical protein HFJ52_08790 [Clostridia bacterium]|nr:hypothetical protein [Clostridia bacterium]
MGQTLIISKNYLLIKNLINSKKISDNIANLYISDNANTTMNVLDNKEIDKIFLDRTMLREYRKNFLIKYKRQITIIEVQEIENKIKIRNLNINDLTMEQSSVERIQEKIIIELKCIGFDFKYDGTKYLVDTILEVYLNREKMIDNLQGYIYPFIAKRYNKTVNNIKNNVINATEYMYRDNSIEKLKKYFRFIEDSKPTVKQVVQLVASKI